MAGTLYLVATPIGNLQDMTFRAVEILRSVEMIACEDTRHTRKLLHAFGISNKLISYHDHNENERSRELAEMLREGRSVALVSDAGTPGINDPGYRLVKLAHELGAAVVPIPGAVAFVNAAAASGLPTDAILFAGFLPSKSGERKRRLTELRDVRATLALYESPHRLAASLSDCLTVLGDREAAIARELTKLHEEIVKGTLSSLIEKYRGERPIGEFVLVIGRGGGEAKTPLPKALSIADRVAELEAECGDHRTALKQAAKEMGISRSEAYRLLQSERA